LKGKREIERELHGALIDWDMVSVNYIVASVVRKVFADYFRIVQIDFRPQDTLQNRPNRVDLFKVLIFIFFNQMVHFCKEYEKIFINFLSRLAAKKFFDT